MPLFRKIVMGPRNAPHRVSRPERYGRAGWGPLGRSAGRGATIRLLVLAIMATVAAGCQTPQPIATVSSVDIERFMGDWYVIASIPTVFEKKAYNALENYRLNEDGTVATRFTFNKGSFEGPLKEYNPRAFVREGTGNAVWGMQFVWPFKAEYLIIYLNEDYTQTVIGRTKRDYVWVMARTPSIPDADYDRIMDLIAQVGYDVGQVRRVPQQPIEAR